jgi:mannose-6-phosphate isomerase class I
LSAGEHEIARLATRLLIPDPHNFVERPWGGHSIRRFKGIQGNPDPDAAPWGEAFEIAAFDADTEARQYPSLLRLSNGASLSLPALLAAEGPRFLGQAFIDRYGACFPLLPKTLSVKELLSVQGHPAGHTEVYVIVDAEPGATLRLGFDRDIDAAAMAAELTRGLEAQRDLLDVLGPGTDGQRLHSRLAPWFADREAPAAAIEELLDRTGGNRLDRATVRPLLLLLKDVYWSVLDSMNAIEVEPGQVIYNATPQRLVDTYGIPVAAEVHALGNPEGREILALEIRRPGPTFRAWDNVRFPQRPVDVQGAIQALNLRATRPEEFVCERVPLEDRPGVSLSVDCEFFRVEHLEPSAGTEIAVPSAPPHSLHCLSGRVEVVAEHGRALGALRQGESALVPVGVADYRVVAEAPAELVRVTLPEG